MTAGHRSGTDWFGQPRGLTVLFLTDTWSLFSFFGMKALLIYYMIKQMGLPASEASLTYGLYSAFTNFTPLFGGIISDRWLGRRRSVTIGGSIMALGHFMMAFEALFYPALVLIALGFGLFMPNLPSQISGLYSDGDPRRSSAYNVYYAGINLGGFLAPLVCGTIGELYGWHYGFSVAGVGMIAAMTIYWAGSAYLPSDALPDRSAITTDATTTDIPLRRVVCVLVGVALAFLVLRIAYDQQGNALAIWIDDGVDRRVLGDVSIPATWFQSINPLIIFVLTPWIIWRWKRQAVSGREPAEPSKMAFGALMMAMSFVVMMIGEHFAGASDATHWTWVATAFVILTIGELHVFPVVLGLFGRLAPAGAKASMITCYFIAAALGNLLAGYVGTFWYSLSHTAYFALLTAICCASAIGFRAMLRQVTDLATALRTF